MSKLAIKGGKAVRTKPYPTWPPYDKREEEQLLGVLHSQNWGGYPSPNVKAAEFAAAFAKAHDAAYGVCVANGSFTLDIALKAADIEAGDEVIVPTYTWLATAACAVNVNAVPVFVDVRPDNYTLDPALVEQAITPRTRAVIPVHLGSSVADLDRLLAICKKHKLVLIEDCAHVHGAQWRGKGVGSHGDFGSFSFQSSKLMTAGEGGIVLTSNKLYEEKLQSIVNCGRKGWGYDSFDGWLFGTNARLSEFQAAVLIAQLAKLEKFTLKRQENGAYLTKLLDDIPGLATIKPDKRMTRVTHYQYIFKYDASGFKGLHRDKFLEALAAEGINADGDFYEPIQERPIFAPKLSQYPMLKKRYPKGINAKAAHTPVAHKAAYEEAVWLHYPYLMGTKKDVEDIAKAIWKIRDNLGELI
ncbi:MAG: DegT/DnrJ/EryC1/StrS family aminotransferase [Myxococcales bacterium]|nr:MAG: DegT/DnrJ/EryC1/StrS family aminotransferase [Myxococcales bacterium]